MAECDYCDSCDYCNTLCQDGCEICNTCQSFCQLGQNSNNGFSFSRCVAKDEIIGPVEYDEYGNEVSTWFTRNTWNEAINRINSIYSRGSYSNASYRRISNNYTDTFMTFEEYKRVADAIGYNYSSEIKKDSVIYGKYFSDLADKIANMPYVSTQCNTCNTSCNTCESCQDCNAECDWCDYCDFCDSGCCENEEDNKK